MSTLGLERLPGRCPEGYDLASQHPALCGCVEGQQRKARILAAVNDSAPADVKAAIDAAILRLARTGREFSANDCRPEFPEVKGAVIGGRFTALGNAGLIRQVEGKRVPSSLASTNGHEIHVWIGAAA